jgi:AAA domain, putative AbiEii toxin, Type IV TA system
MNGGSQWHRWDPHLHSPGTALNSGYEPDSVEAWFQRARAAQPAVRALGVTDYFSIRGYKSVKSYADQNNIEDLYLFPNVELRLIVGTSEGSGINLHLLFSPDDHDHVARIEAALARFSFKSRSETYPCTEAGLAALGRAIKSDPSLPEAAAISEGADKYKVSLEDVRTLFESEWVTNNCLVAVAARTKDGTSGLQSDASFDEVRREIERLSRLIFSATPSNASFWLGEGKLSPQQIIDQYGSLKPCIHGSDAHRLDDVAKPDLDRYTWVKGDVTFDSLRQACLEPQRRVRISDKKPSDGATRAVTHLSTPGTHWLLGDVGLPLSDGLVAIIGARGSGKTALADLIAVGGGNDVAGLNKKSFVQRAKDHMANVQVSTTWDAQNLVSNSVLHSDYPDSPEVRYLSQQFVDRLCSEDDMADELIDEIENVVYSTIPADEREDANSFKELLARRLFDSRRRKEQCAERLERLSDEISTELQKRDSIPAISKRIENLRTDHSRDTAERDRIVAKGNVDLAPLLEIIRTALENRETQLQQLRKSLATLRSLLDEVATAKANAFPLWAHDLRKKYPSAFPEDAWPSFEVDFVSDPSPAVIGQISDIEAREKTLVGVNANRVTKDSTTFAELSDFSLGELRIAQDAVGKRIGVDKSNLTRLGILSKKIEGARLETPKLEAQLVDAQQATDRRKALIEQRSQTYRSFFMAVVEEGEELLKLYSRLGEQLAAGGESLGRLSLSVIRTVDIQRWAAVGERLVDLRRSGPAKGAGALELLARDALLEAWQTGDADTVTAAMAKFRTDYDDELKACGLVEKASEKYPTWLTEMGRWLYSTDHIRVSYSFTYDDVPLQQLSPGTRGVVLLLLYLVLDVADTRPLIIDQPEENLDPQSIYRVLVPLFRDVRTRRQVFIVTHNANLVVNTDVDQVIIATCTRGSENEPPTFSYTAGGLENSQVRNAVCEILEGGEAAFRERAKRLRVSFA